MKNHELIDQLATNLKPVRPFSPLRNTLIWAVVSLVSITILLLTMMPLRQVSQMLGQPVSVISGLCFLLSSVFLAFTVNLMAVPGRTNRRLMLWISLAIYLLLFSVLLGTAISLKGLIVLSGTDCVMGVIILSIVPLIFFFNIIRKLAPTSQCLTGLLLGLAACALGAFGIGFSCASGYPLHLLVFHLTAPALLLGGLGSFVGKKWLKW